MCFARTSIAVFLGSHSFLACYKSIPWIDNYRAEEQSYQDTGNGDRVKV